jgi:hypothetical protein
MAFRWAARDRPRYENCGKVSVMNDAKSSVSLNPPAAARPLTAPGSVARPQVLATAMTSLRRFFPGEPTKEQAKDTGMALVLVFLILAVAKKKFGYVELAVVFHVINMIAPQVFRPAAVLWFGLSQLMGNVVSRIVMVIVFFAIVTPIAMWRRMQGADTLRLKIFKAGRGSVMEQRNHTFSRKDLEKPY